MRLHNAIMLNRAVYAPIEVIEGSILLHNPMDRELEIPDPEVPTTVAWSA